MKTDARERLDEIRECKKHDASSNPLGYASVAGLETRVQKQACTGTAHEQRRVECSRRLAKDVDEGLQIKGPAVKDQESCCDNRDGTGLRSSGKLSCHCGFVHHTRCGSYGITLTLATPA